MEFAATPRPEQDGFLIDVQADGRTGNYLVRTATQQEFNAFFRELAADFGTRVPHIFTRSTEHPAPSFKEASASVRAART